MAWTGADGDALFRQPPDGHPRDDASPAFDGSSEAMRRLRFPFETPTAAPAEPDRDAPVRDGDRRD